MRRSHGKSRGSLGSYMYIPCRMLRQAVASGSMRAPLIIPVVIVMVMY